MLTADDLKVVLASAPLRQAHGLELPQGSLTTLALDAGAFDSFYQRWTAEGQPRYEPPAQQAAPVPVAPMPVARVQAAPVQAAPPVAVAAPPMSPYGPPPTLSATSSQLSPSSSFSRDPSVSRDSSAVATATGYSSFMNSPNAVRPTGLNRPGAGQMLAGFGIAGIGVVITAVTWAIAAPGGTFVVAWGAIVFGTIRGIIGAVRMSRG
jgi:hypothetical protein